MTKKHYYILVLTGENQGKFVTKVDNKTKTAYWNTNEKPMKFNKQYAEDLVYCLCLNFNTAFVIESYFEIDGHYFYKEKKNEKV